MPSVIPPLVALLKMRDYNYRILLDRDARLARAKCCGCSCKMGAWWRQRAFKEAGALEQALAAERP